MTGARRVITLRAPVAYSYGNIKKTREKSAPASKYAVGSP